VEEPSFPDALLAALREESRSPDLAYAQPPSPIEAGHETAVYALELRGGPPGFSGPLIARHIVRPGLARAASLEAAVHDGLRAQGFPAPRVLVARDATPACVVMERLPGRSLGEGAELGRGPAEDLAALVAMARLSWRLPSLLGVWTARLLALDAEPVQRALEARGLPPAAIRFERHLEAFAERVERAALRGFEAGLRWLREARPPEPERLCVCHGDLAANLMVEGARVTGVIDWSSRFVTLGDPAFEIANTRVMLQVPLPLPGPLRRASDAYQGGLARRYARALGPAWSVAPERLRYYEAWRCFLALLGAAELWRARARGAPLPERKDPWSLPAIAAQTAANFRVRSGVAVELPAAPG
jgi:aminoglycoside phosphotransferase (APT) family kinase protein